VLGTLDAGGLVDQYPQRLASAIEAVGQQAGVGLVQGVVGIVKLSSLGHDEYILSALLQPRQTIAAGWGASGGLAGA
jgi:hypothetical protein